MNATAQEFSQDSMATTRLMRWSIVVAVACIALPFHRFQQQCWQLTLGFLSVCFLLLLHPDHSMPLVQPRADWPLWMCVLALAAGIITPLDHAMAVKRYLELSATLWLFFYMGKTLSRHTSTRAMVCVAFGVCGGLVACYAIGYAAFHMHSSFFFRSSISENMYRAFQHEYQRTFHPTLLSNYLVLSSAFALPLLHHSSPLMRRLGQAALALTIVCLFIPFWRGAVPVFAVMWLTYGLLHRKPLTIFAVTVLLWVGWVISLAGPPHLNYASIRNTLVESRRSVRLQKGWSMFLDSPLMGQGFERYRELFDHTTPLNSPQLQPPITNPDLKVADNMYCTLLAETGMIGCMGFLVLATVLLWRGWAALRSTDDARRIFLTAGIMVLVGSLLSMLSYETFYWHTPFILLSLICGWLAGLASLRSIRAVACVNEERADLQWHGRPGRMAPMSTSVMARWCWMLALCGAALAAAFFPTRTWSLYPIEQHDGWGFNNAVVPAKTDVVAFGSALTYGRMVERNQAWPQQLARLGGIATYNMAFPGPGPIGGLMLLESSLALHPRVIVQAFYSGSDFRKAYEWVYERGECAPLKPNDPQYVARMDAVEQVDPLKNIERLKWWITDPELHTASWETLKQTAHDHASYFLAVDTARTRTILTPAYRLAMLDTDDPRLWEGFRLSLEAMASAQERLRAYGVEYLVLLIPSKEFAYQELVAPGERPASYRKVLAYEQRLWQEAKHFFLQHDMQTVDALPAFQASLRRGESPYYFTLTAYPNATGHRLMAELVLTALSASRLPNTGVKMGGADGRRRPDARAAWKHRERTAVAMQASASVPLNQESSR